MKVVKEFSDPLFLEKPSISSPDAEIEGHRWIWALGDDGELYYRCTKFSRPSEWYCFKNSDIARFVTVSDMKRIVSEFGHLLIFL
jgi:hypothetical protein